MRATSRTGRSSLPSRRPNRRCRGRRTWYDPVRQLRLCARGRPVIDLPLVSLDLEILETDAGSEIIEVGAVKFRGDETLDTFSALIRPKGALSFKIGNLTGLTARDLARGEPLRAVLDRLSTFVGGATIVGQSIGLDLDHLKKAGLDLANRRFDTFELAVLLRPGLKAYDLGSIARDLSV